jgi:hypothetical protein
VRTELLSRRLRDKKLGNCAAIRRRGLACIWKELDFCGILPGQGWRDLLESYGLVIVGAGPAGLSAAARAAQIDRRENSSPS